MYKIVYFVMVVVCLALAVEAQLTFTSSWGGKRSGGPGSPGAPIMCRSDDAVANIYRMIQNEAERLLLCQKP